MISDGDINITTETIQLRKVYFASARYEGTRYHAYAYSEREAKYKLMQEIRSQLKDKPNPERS